MIDKTEQEIMKNWKGYIIKPVVSICSITYNHEKYISEAIDSFLIQETDFPFEIVIGEDCSTDDTRKVIEEYIKKYPNLIKLTTSKYNVGPYENFNRTIQNCKGEYVAFCEGDDYWIDKFKLQNSVDILKSNKELSFIFHKALTNQENSVGFSKKNLINLDDWITDDLSIITASVVVKNDKQLVSKLINTKYVGFYMSICIFLEYGKGKFIDKEMSFYRIHQGGIWSSLDFYNQSLFALENIECMIDYYKNSKYEKVLVKKYRNKVISSSVELILLRKFNLFIKLNNRKEIYKLKFKDYITLSCLLIKRTFLIINNKVFNK